MDRNSAAYSGLLISFEGIDGSGKSTQLRLLAERLEAAGYPVVTTVEPGGTDIGQQIRTILLNPANKRMAQRTELLLYFASRAENMAQTILPALRRGAIVLTDRFTDSTLAYQGYARGVGPSVVWNLHQIACGAVLPDITFCFDVELEVSIARREQRLAAAAAAAAGAATVGTVETETAPAPAVRDRLESESRSFHARVRRAFLEIAALHPRRWRVIDANADPQVIADSVWTALQPLLENRTPTQQSA